MDKIKTKKCKCGSEFEQYNSMQNACVPCLAKKGKEINQKKRKKLLDKAKKEYNKETKRRREAIRRRSEWYALLQTEVNKYIRLRDKDEPCCTCGATNPDIKYDAGHYRTAGGNPELRFELTNIHKQCSVRCNQHGSGMRKEYREFIMAKYGEDHLAWLDGTHQTLKQKFPHIEDIQSEIKRFRMLNKELENFHKA